MLCNIKYIIKRTLLSVILFTNTFLVLSQTQGIREPVIENPNDATILWLANGGVTVTGDGEVTFTSRIVGQNHSQRTAPPIKASQMLLLDKIMLNVGVAFFKEHGIDVVSKGEGARASIKAYTPVRPTSGPPTEENDYNYDFDDDDFIVYATNPDAEIPGIDDDDTLVNESYELPGYYVLKKGLGVFNRRQKLNSIDFSSLYNRPDRFTWKSTVENVFNGILLAVSLYEIYGLFETGFTYARTVYSGYRVLRSTEAAKAGRNAFIKAAEDLQKLDAASVENPKGNKEFLPYPDEQRYYKSISRAIKKAAEYRSIAFTLGRPIVPILLVFLINCSHEQSLDNRNKGYEPTTSDQFLADPSEIFDGYDDDEFPPGFDVEGFYDFYKSTLSWKAKREKNIPKCSFDLTKHCYYYHRVPSVVKMKMKNSSVRNISIPTALSGYTPYQLFKNMEYFYTPTKIYVSANNNDNIDQVATEDKFIKEQILPYNMINNSDDEVLTVSFQDHADKFFYILSSGVSPELINLEIGVDYYVRQLKDFGKTKIGDNTHLLYRYDIVSDDHRIQFNVTRDGPFLAGDNLVITDKVNIQEDFHLTTLDDIDYDNFIDEDGNTIPQEQDPDVVALIKGNVTISTLPEADQTLEIPDQVVLNAFKLAHHDDDTTDPDENTVEKGGMIVGLKDESYPVKTGIAIIDDPLYSPELPDYVFNSDYKLKSLEELEKYVKQYKHLPNVPSQADIKKDKHLSVSKTLMGQLQNLEEMYLHTFKQRRTLKKQRVEIDSIKNKLQTLHKRIEKLTPHKNENK